jgi:hypothetical protein
MRGVKVRIMEQMREKGEKREVGMGKIEGKRITREEG